VNARTSGNPCCFPSSTTSLSSHPSSYQRSYLLANARAQGNHDCFPSTTTLSRSRPSIRCRRPAFGRTVGRGIASEPSGWRSWTCWTIYTEYAACLASKCPPFRARRDLRLQTMNPSCTRKSGHPPGESLQLFWKRWPFWLSSCQSESSSLWTCQR
jgi:hypothetical protein